MLNLLKTTPSKFANNTITVLDYLPLSCEFSYAPVCEFDWYM